MEAARTLGLSPDKWIRELQVQGPNEDSIVIDGSSFSSRELAKKVLIPQKPFVLGYITDVVFDGSNTQLIKEHFLGTDLLICEASFRRAEVHRAKKRYHLTTYQAALLGAVTEAKYLTIFHISNIYAGDTETSVKEAGDFFQNLKLKKPDELDQLIDFELDQ